MPAARASASSSRPITRAIRDYYEGAGRPSRLADRLCGAADRRRHRARGAKRAALMPAAIRSSCSIPTTCIRRRSLRALVDLDGPGLPAYDVDSLVRDSGFPRDRVMGFAAIEVDDRGHLTRIVEKPGREYYDAPGSRALISMNVWRFDERIFDACRDVPLSARGEYELPEAVGLAVSRGVVFRTFRASGAVLDLSRRSDVALVNARLAGVEPRP